MLIYISSGSIPVEESPKNLGNNKPAQLVSENVLPLADEDDADDDSSNYEPTYSEEERMEDELMDEMGKDAPEDKILIEDALIATNDVINHIREVLGKRKRSKLGKAKRESWTRIKIKIKRLKGEEYYGRRKTEGGTIVFDVQKSKRTLKRRCSCTNNNRRNLKCFNITEEKKYIYLKPFRI